MTLKAVGVAGENGSQPRQLIFESFLEHNKEISYVLQTDGTVTKINARKSSNYFAEIKFLLYEIFLPRGYPDSVAEDYTTYQIWDTLQGCFSSFCSMLALQAVLKGVGVGNETATATSAVLTWIIKDGAAMTTSIMFTWLRGSYLDSKCKKWRLCADVINDVAFCIELTIPSYSDYTLPLLCLSSSLKAIVTVAGGATRAALTFHQAMKGNSADVSAKDGSQETLVNLCAMGIWAFLLHSPLIQENVWPVMAVLIFLHLFCNYRAIRAVLMYRFNQERYLLTLESYLTSGEAPSVPEVNYRESVILGRGISSKNICGFTIKLGESLKDINFQSIKIDSVVELYKNTNYMLVVDSLKKTIYIAVEDGISDTDVLKAYFHAVMLGHLLAKDTTGLADSPMRRLHDAYTDHKAADKVCLSNIDNEFETFLKMAKEKKWDMNINILNLEQWRALWRTDNLVKKLQ